MMNNSGRVEAMKACKKYEKCSANVCPLDPEFEKTKHFAGDRFCHYLMEHAKAGSKALFEHKGRIDIHDRITEIIPKLFALSGVLKSQYEKASKTGSRMGKKPRWGEDE